MQKFSIAHYRILIAVAVMILGASALAVNAATSGTGKNCGNCAMDHGESETVVATGCCSQGEVIEQECKVPVCHVCDESCEVNGCNHEHSMACVEIYREGIMAWVGEACAHECLEGCSEGGCRHVHGESCYQAFAEDMDTKCTEDCSDKCIGLMELVQDPCNHVCTDLCEADGCNHVCSEPCVDAFFSELENLEGTS
jgi:hypothetical protein